MDKTFLQQYRELSGKNVKLVDKEKSLLMKFINLCIRIGNFLGLCDITHFLQDYTTTIGHTIYTQPADIKKWEEGGVDQLLIHELTHVEQWCFKMPLEYIFSKNGRAYYESECVLAELLCFRNSIKNIVPTKGLVKEYAKYGIDTEIMLDILTRQLYRAQYGSIPENPRTVVDIFTVPKHDH
jgi:hypothetical protein